VTETELVIKCHCLRDIELQLGACLIAMLSYVSD